MDHAVGNFTSSLQRILYATDNPQVTAIDPDATSFTVQVFSTHDERPLLEHYHTATSARSNTVGVNNVDEDTVFRIGSASKLWTVLLLLIETGDASFHDPIFKYIPELRDVVSHAKGNNSYVDSVDHVQWEDVTVGEIASQMAGLERSFGLGDLARTSLAGNLGFPHLRSSAVPKCGIEPACSRSEFFAGLLKRHPVLPTSSGAAYSNDGYQLLAYAIEAMSGMSYSELLEKRLIQRLNLTHSSYGKPADHLGIIPEPRNMSNWDTDLGDLAPTGGIYSSTKDLNTLGRAILNSELLSPAQTRRWMKPHTRTADPSYLVGAPWEIYTVDDPRAIDLYTKSGDLGGYSAMMGLSPDHDVGFVILAAGEKTTRTVYALADLVSQGIIPGLESAAKEDARDRFAGTYTLGGSVLTLTTDDGPGLKITKWNNKGKDILETLATLQPADIEGELDVRLYPTGLESPGKVSFRGIVSGAAPTGPANGPFTRACKSWMLVDGQVYGSVGLDEFVFDMLDNGGAVRVSPRALRVSLARVR
ncbi:serine hydrolase domain-containing protein [Aspergillus puulaauensis]|uniref:Beta-lactamase/transpeptidase-like protein n=1 Tax=Aspergillus puulaauensis TaxID=1220207 RepID=A0A7R7XQ86_9EURO|nr:uncharacterized protein APUU_50125S [Aspergillus puulaauensis]BCS25414.1 hypothetical protein APUU_50125S [Aspergillus puulaauensis]